MIRSILAAAIVSVGVVSAALAFTPSPATSPQLTAASDLLQVKYKGNKGYKGNRKGKNWNYKHNHNYHYKNAPKGWHSYSYRPYRWAHRGCVIVGPVWYCP